ncbi:uncharacterized protein LOC121800790 [Salvia splendens]|uniref:uncharacterized protein LOC121800790 n=1 Tax=Salvia splendens TaxID=180675 RepID=UPI001C274350|nr:uncharacterized protein LOC121800790 [Salvia splendens]
MTRRPVHVKKYDGKRLRAICRGKSCEWYVYARRVESHNDTDFVVLNMQRDHAHTCSQVLDQRWLTSKWLAERYMEKIKANPHIPLAAIRQCVDEEFGLQVGRMKAYRARDSALEGIFGKAGLQYRRLFDYKAELERTHADSSVHIHNDNFRDPEVVSPRFLRGQLVTAMGIDPNNGWWPIAWAVTEAESYEQWKWFLGYLAEDLLIRENAPRFVFMSDQQKICGLAKVILEDFPQNEHRFCVQHIYNNFKKRFIGENFKEMLWELASSTTQEEYVERMNALWIIYPQAHQYLLGVAPKEKWVKAYFSPHVCCDVILNNICETFNSKIAIARELAIVTMLEEIRTSQMEKIQIRGQWIKTYAHAMPPVIKEIVDKYLARASSWRPTWNGEDSYQVSGPSGQYVVNMRKFTCSCRLWQLNRIPCTHAIATINKNGKDVADYVSCYYLRSTMTLLYENVLYPINGMDNWPKNSEVGFELAPPRTKRQRGRPKKLRREDLQIFTFITFHAKFGFKITMHNTIGSELFFKPVSFELDLLKPIVCKVHHQSGAGLRQGMELSEMPFKAKRPFGPKNGYKYLIRD